jgi:aquaporin Z
MSTPVPARHDAFQSSGTEAAQPRLLPRLVAEAFGSFFLALAGLGVPLFSIPQSSPLPAALAAGLAVTAAMLAFGHVSGGHFNPAITAGHLVAGRIRAGAAAAYAAAQLAGGLVAALALYGILRTLPGIADSRTAFDTVTAGFGEHSIIQAPLAAALLLEMIGAAIITAVFLGTARPDSNRSAAPVAVGLSFAVLLQLGLSVGNLPFNPARAVASAVFSSGWAVEQLWVFVAAPLVGAIIAGLAFRSFGAGTAASGEALAAADAVRDSAEDGAQDEEDGVAAQEAAAVDAKPVAADAAAAKTVASGTKAETSEAQEFFEGRRG